MTGIPRIKVSVEYQGKEVFHYGSHFIDAISFLCKVEECIRSKKSLQDPVDNITTKIQSRNSLELKDGSYSWAVYTHDGEKFYRSCPELLSDLAPVLDPQIVIPLHNELLSFHVGQSKEISVGGYLFKIVRLKD